jgi:hypothetical protein
MADKPEVVKLIPRWMRSIGSIFSSNAQLRSECMKCGTVLREDPAALSARHGLGTNFIGRRERCRVVGCSGVVRFWAARTYGQAWTALEGDGSSTDRHHARG